jgi:phosphocarrier protein
MKSVNIVLENKTGLHARPASELAKIATKYKSNINMKVNGKNINLKSVLAIMSAGIKENTNLEIICDGEDEQQAMQEILDGFKNRFGE